MGATPDLVISSRSASVTSSQVGSTFILYAAVHNQGTGTAVSTILRYYRSSNSTITRSDTAVGTESIRALGYRETVGRQTSITAPSSAGTYYYGVCVDSVSGETNTNNNCSDGVEVTVISSTSPDLIISSRSVSDSTLTTGASFTLYATVYNQGASTANSTTLRYYRSSDSAISSSDTYLGSDSVISLGVSRISYESIGLNAPSSGGTYYYGACVVSVSRESDTGNNCSDGVRVTVASGPDLIIPSSSLELSLGSFSSSSRVSSISLAPGAYFRLYATVRNQGNQGSGRSDSTYLRYYRSTNSTISRNDSEEDSDYVRSLDYDETSDENERLTAPSTAGTYYYGVCVDSVPGETNTSNNCSTWVRVTVSSAPDLVVISPRVDDACLYTGGRDWVNLGATVRNQGSGRSDGTYLRYYISSNSTISRSDTRLSDTDYVIPLSSDRSSAESTYIEDGTHLTFRNGTYYFGACVDSVSGESDTSNNCSEGVRVIFNNTGYGC